MLAELRSIYYLKMQGCIITALEPERLDAIFWDVAGNEWSAEIKCPSYEKEILERGLSPEETRKRKQDPKYSPKGIFAFNFDYRDSIRKSVDKFHAGDRNLLLISDNLFMSLNGDPCFDTNVRSQLQEEDGCGKISCVACLHVKGFSSGESAFQYCYRSAKITDEPVLND